MAHLLQATRPGLREVKRLPRGTQPDSGLGGLMPFPVEARSRAGLGADGQWCRCPRRRLEEAKGLTNVHRGVTFCFFEKSCERADPF